MTMCSFRETRVLTRTSPKVGKASPSPSVHAQEDKGITSTATTVGEPVSQRCPGYGTLGTPLHLRTNHFQLQAGGKTLIHKYNVTFHGLENLQYGEKEHEADGDPLVHGLAPKPEVAQPQTGDKDASQSVSASAPQSKSQRGLIRKRRRMFEILLKHEIFVTNGQAVATDYAETVFTAKKLVIPPDLKINYSMVDGAPERDDPCRVNVDFKQSYQLDLINKYPLGPFSKPKPEDTEDIIQALKLIVKQQPRTTGNLFGGREDSKCFPFASESEILSPCIVALKGYHASIRPSTARLLVNLNVCTSAFYQEGYVDVVIKHLTSGIFSRQDAEAFLKMRRVKVEHQQRRPKTICGFAKDPITNEYLTANTAKFRLSEENGEEGAEITAAKYFETKDLRLKEPDLPLLNLGKLHDRRTKVAEPAKTVGADLGAMAQNLSLSESSKTQPRYEFMPPEQCLLMPGQAYGKKLDRDQTDKMRNFAVRPLAENARRIVDAAQHVFDFSPGNPVLKGFGLGLSPHMITVPGRILPSPQPLYSQASKAVVARGSWDMRGKKLSIGKGGSVAWSTLTINQNPNANEVRAEWITKLGEHFAESGLGTLKKGKDFTVSATGDLDAALRKVLDKVQVAGIKILLVLLSDDDALFYSRLKFLADLEYGIHTVCTIHSKFRLK